MKTLVTVLALLIAINSQAQHTVETSKQNKPVEPGVQPWGKVDMADLEMKSCDFEPDANAEVLFDKAVSSIGPTSFPLIERHVRVKVFNEFGKGRGSVRISYGTTNLPPVSDIDAETFNLENGQIVTTKIDKKLIYTEKTDKYHSTLIFALPNVKAGSVFEFKYKWDIGYYPDWFFQSELPTRYSEIKTMKPSSTTFSNTRVIPHIKQALVKDEGKADDFTQVKAMSNVHSLPDEPYMSSWPDNLQHMEYITIFSFFENWGKIGDIINKDNLFYEAFNGNVKDEAYLTVASKELKTTDEKVKLIFDFVKNKLAWNGITSCFPSTTNADTWNKNTGNTADINLILYHLLKKAGIKANPIITSTKKMGKLNPANPSLNKFQNLAVYVPVDSTTTYVLDASNKYNLYNTIPANFLNVNAFRIEEKGDGKSDIIFLSSDTPTMQSVFSTATVNADGNVAGTAEITSSAHNKTLALTSYNKDGEEKYIDNLRSGSNAKINNLKLEDRDDDNVPLKQTFSFSSNTSGADGYLSFAINTFNVFGKNPFIAENRQTDVDMGYRDNYLINAIYKVPAGYKTDALPKSVKLAMPDRSILFTRTITEQDGTIAVRLVLNHVQTLFFAQDYADLRSFYKQVYEMLNEEIVLKKI